METVEENGKKLLVSVFSFRRKSRNYVSRLKEQWSVACGLPTTRELVEAGLTNEGTVLMQEITRSWSINKLLYTVA